jgi:hypothetical protein
MLIADEHGQTGVNATNYRRCMMYKNFALLSIGAALLLSLSFFDDSQAFQIEKRQESPRIVMGGEMKGTANPTNKHVSNTPNPCTEGGKGRTGAPGKTRCPLDSGEKTAAGSHYTSATMLR